MLEQSPMLKKVLESIDKAKHVEDARAKEEAVVAADGCMDTAEVEVVEDPPMELVVDLAIKGACGVASSEEPSSTDTFGVTKQTCNVTGNMEQVRYHGTSHASCKSSIVCP